MRITIEQEFRLPRFNYNKWICKVRGHIWKPYKQPTDSLVSRWILSYQWFDGREIAKECSRCGQYTYKKMKPKTVKFSRYSKWI